MTVGKALPSPITSSTAGRWRSPRRSASTWPWDLDSQVFSAQRQGFPDKRYTCTVIMMICIWVVQRVCCFGEANTEYRNTGIPFSPGMLHQPTLGLAQWAHGQHARKKKQGVVSSPWPIDRKPQHKPHFVQAINQSQERWDNNGQYKHYTKKVIKKFHWIPKISKFPYLWSYAISVEKVTVVVPTVNYGLLHELRIPILHKI